MAASAVMAMFATLAPEAHAQRAAEHNAPSLVRVVAAPDASLPQPLATSDAQRLRRAFEAQARGDAATAQREAERVADRRLHGHLLAKRLLRPGQEPAATALHAWLLEHADLPDAQAIHDALLRRLPRGVAAPPAPLGPDEQAATPTIIPEDQRASAALVRRATLDRAVQARLSEGRPDLALRAVAAAQGLPRGYAAQLRAEIAQVVFRQGDHAEARRLSEEALGLDAPNPAAAHQAGLSAWAGRDYAAAFAFFERAARSERAASALRASAAYWAARAAVRARRPAQYAPWMLLAAQETRTFHGMIARRALGLPPALVWERDADDAGHAAALTETAGGWRALALLQIGQHGRAEAELRQLHRRARNNPRMLQGILAVSQRAGFTELATRAAEDLPGEGVLARDSARYPLPSLMPPSGFRLDPSLLYALALQESRFNPNAVSRAGARGLLQILPSTASYVAGDPSLRRGAGMRRLHDPAFSLEIGQRYLHYLARQEAVRGDLIRLLAAYNAGPGNLARWSGSMGHSDDPMLFIESIPVAETRAFVRRVLTYSWIYANRLDLPTPSLDALAAGEFPRFSDADEVTAMLRERPRLAN
jgi:soluble lytic murein transglycosylase